jgi:uncharacterized SAM-dependent methyltransferase
MKFSRTEREPKHLLSKYFYDKKGDELFQQIMNMPEYYLTDCELEIFTGKKLNCKTQLAFDESFDLVDSEQEMLQNLLFYWNILSAKADFTYMPIDISANII